MTRHEIARYVIILIAWLSMIWPVCALTGDLRSQYRMWRRRVEIPAAGMAIYFGVCGFFTFLMLKVP